MEIENMWGAVCRGFGSASVDPFFDMWRPIRCELLFAPVGPLVEILCWILSGLFFPLFGNGDHQRFLVCFFGMIRPVEAFVHLDVVSLLWKQTSCVLAAVCVFVLGAYVRSRHGIDKKSLVGLFCFWFLINLGITHAFWFLVCLMVLIWCRNFSRPIVWILICVNPPLLVFKEVRDELFLTFFDGREMVVRHGPVLSKVVRDGGIYSWLVLIFSPMNYGTMTCLIFIDWCFDWEVFGFGLDLTLFLRRSFMRIYREILMGYSVCWLRGVEKNCDLIADDDHSGVEWFGCWQYSLVGKARTLKHGEGLEQYGVLFGRISVVTDRLWLHELNPVHCMGMDDNSLQNMWRQHVKRLRGDFKPFIGCFTYCVLWVLNWIPSYLDWWPIYFVGGVAIVVAMFEFCWFEHFPRFRLWADIEMCCLATVICDKTRSYVRLCRRFVSTGGLIGILAITSLFRLNEFWLVMLIWSIFSMCFWGVGAEKHWDHHNFWNNITKLLVDNGVSETELETLETRWNYISLDEQGAVMLVEFLRSPMLWSCGLDCQLKNFVLIFDTVVFCCVVCWFLLSYWYVLKLFLNPLMVWVVLVCIMIGGFFPVSWFFVMVLVVVICVVLSIWFRGYGTIDIMAVVLVSVPYCLILTLLRWLAGYIVISQAQIVMLAFVVGCCCGITILVWLRSFTWAKYHVIVERDEDGRIVVKRVKFPLFANVIFGKVVGHIVGNLAAVATKLGEAVIDREGIMKRFTAGLAFDNKLSGDFVRQMMDNAHSQGTLNDFLKMLNEGGVFDSNVMVGFKQSIDPSWLGVVEIYCDGVWSPRGNGVVVRFGNGVGIVTNAHVVCDLDSLERVFCGCDDSAFKSNCDIRFNNGNEIFDLKVVTWNASADLAILSNSLLKDGFQVGNYVSGKDYVWAGVAPPLTQPNRKFMISVKPGPLGAVIGPHSERGDSGSVLLDSNGKLVAIKYGCSQIMDVGVGNSGYFVPLSCCKDVDFKAKKMDFKLGEKILASSLVDVDRLGAEDYVKFCQQWLQLSESDSVEMEEAFKNRDKAKVADLLARIGSRNVDIGAHVKLLSGKLLEAKARNHFLMQQHASSEQNIGLKQELDKVKAQIKELTVLGDVWPDDDELVKVYKEKKQEIDDLVKQLREKFPVKVDKERNKLLGALGMRKFQLEQQLKVDGIDQESLADLKKQLTQLNEVKTKIVEIISKGRDWYNELSEDFKAVMSRMPDQLKRVNYPFCYCDVNGVWHTWLSDNEEVVTEKHPAVDSLVLSKAENFGLTEKQWKKKLQKSVVSEVWATKIIKYIMQVDPSWLPRCFSHWIVKHEQLESCGNTVMCPWCGFVLICDKRDHVGCSKYLVEKLDKHQTSCKMNRIEKENFWYMGLPFKIVGGKISLEGKKCEFGDVNHKCWKLTEDMERDEKGVVKHARHVHLYDSNGSLSLWVVKNCCDGLLKGHKFQAIACDEDLLNRIKVLEDGLEVQNCGIGFVDRFKTLEEKIKKWFSHGDNIEKIVKSVEEKLIEKDKKNDDLIREIDKRFEGGFKKMDVKISQNMDVVGDKLAVLTSRIDKLMQRDIVSSRHDEQLCALEAQVSSIVEALDKVSQVQQTIDKDVDLIKGEVEKVVPVVEWDVAQSSWAEVVERKPQREIKRSGKPEPVKVEEVKVKTSNFNGERNFEKRQLFVGGGVEKHSNLNGDCHCPKCQCEADCKCEVCSGMACIWCNVVGHSVRTCPYAIKRCCKKCQKPISDWFGLTLVDRNRGRMGCKVLCCEEQTRCVVCVDGDHHGLSCPVLRHSNLSCNPDTINCFGLSEDIVKSVILPMEQRNGNGNRIVKKERRERDP